MNQLQDKNFIELEQQFQNQEDIPKDQETIIYRLASQIKTKPIDWLWKGRIARGKVSIIAGNPGLGKSQLTANMAAIVTRGGAWPVDKASCQKGGVIFLSAEDDPADTIVPRLKAVDADLEKVVIIESVSTGVNHVGEVIPKQFNLATDLPHLDRTLAQLKDTALIIIDPITAYLGETDSHRTADVRALLAPVSRLAEKYNVAIVCITHLNKGGNNEALMRFTGSLGFVAAARAAYVVVKDQDDPTKRLFLPAKNNLGNDQTGLAFSIKPCVVESNIETSGIDWFPDIVTVTADEAMGSSIDEPQERSALEEAKEFLNKLLENGYRPVKEIKKLAGSEMISEKTLRTAKSKLGIKSGRHGFGRDSVPFWYLPNDTSIHAHTDHTSPAKSLGMYDSYGQVWDESKGFCPGGCGYQLPVCSCKHGGAHA